MSGMKIILSAEYQSNFHEASLMKHTQPLHAKSENILSWKEPTCMKMLPS